MSNLEDRQNAMRAKHQRNRRYRPTPITKREYLELIIKKFRDPKTPITSFTSLARQLGEVKGWLQPLPRTNNMKKKDRTEELQADKAPDLNELVLEAEQAKGK